MRYSNIIILRITDFQDFFSFEEFWKNRKLFPVVSKDPRFGRSSINNDMEGSCVNIVNEWLEGLPFSYYMNNSLTLLKKIDGAHIGKFDSDVYDFLRSQNDSVIESNLLSLCSLYQLLPKDYRLKAIERDINIIKQSLSLANIDFSKSLVNFEEAGKAISIRIETADISENIGYHVVMISNESARHRVVIISARDEKILCELKPNGFTLALLDNKNQWICEIPIKGRTRSCNLAIERTSESEPNKRKLVCRDTQSNGNSYTWVECSDIISFSANFYGFVFITRDSFKPLIFNHNFYDSDIVRSVLRGKLNRNERPQHVDFLENGIRIFTNMRIIDISKNEIK